MKKLTTYLGVLAAVIMAAFVAACGKSGGGNNPLPTPCYGSHCVVNPSGSKLSFASQNTMMSYYYPAYGNTMQTFSGLRTIMKEAMGVCDRNHSDGGLASCSAWMSGFHDITISANGAQANSVKLIMRSYPYQSGIYYSYSLPSFDQFFLGLFGFNTFNMQYVYNPMILEMSINPINNSQGFELRGYGPYWSLGGRKLIQLQVPVGKFEDPQFNYDLYYNAEKVASGSLLRCPNQQCNLPFMP